MLLSPDSQLVMEFQSVVFFDYLFKKVVHYFKSRSDDIFLTKKTDAPKPLSGEIISPLRGVVGFCESFFSNNITSLCGLKPAR